MSIHSRSRPSSIVDVVQIAFPIPLQFHASSITQGGNHIIARGTARTLCAIADPMRREMRSCAASLRDVRD